MMSTIASPSPPMCYGLTAMKAPSDGGADRIDSGPAPGPPADIDFSNIDCPTKAALLPTLNATTLFIMMQAFTSGYALDSTLSMTIGASQRAELNFDVSDPSTLTMQAAGFMGDVPFKEDWTLNPFEGYLTINGIIGGSQEALKLTDTAHRRGRDSHLDGTIGKLEVHEAITQQGEGDDARIVWDGTVGDQKIHQELGIEGKANQNQVIHVKGTLGDAPITMDTSLTLPDNKSAFLSAQGNIAGTALSYTQSVKFQRPGTNA